MEEEMRGIEKNIEKIQTKIIQLDDMLPKEKANSGLPQHAGHFVLSCMRQVLFAGKCEYEFEIYI
ncbi:MAG: hypothetical protein ACLTK0_04180 [Anaerovoracaceae bacterium]